MARLSSRRGLSSEPCLILEDAACRPGSGDASTQVESPGARAGTAIAKLRRMALLINPRRLINTETLPNVDTQSQAPAAPPEAPMAPLTFNPRQLRLDDAAPTNAVSGVALASASTPDAMRRLLEAKLPPKAASERPDGWLYLDGASLEAKTYAAIIPTLAVASEDPSPASLAGLGMPQVTDQARLDKLDRVHQMPLTFKSLEEARAWKPTLPPEAGEWSMLSSLQRDADGRAPFAGIDSLSSAEQSQILADPRRAYGSQLGLLDGSMPALPPPFAPDARPNAAIYVTDPGQQAIIKSQVPKLTVEVGDHPLSKSTAQVPNEPVLRALDAMYGMPTRFNSVEEAKAWHPAPKVMTAGGDAVQLAIYNNTVASAHPWEHIDQFPPEVQRKIIEDPRLAFAGLNGLIKQHAPAGFKPMRSEPTPSGRYVSFEEEMGGYSPRWAKDATWVPDSGLMLPEEASFVPHRYKEDLIGDRLLPAVAQIASGAITGGLGLVGGAAFSAAGAALTTEGSPLRAALGSLGGSILGAGLQPISGAISDSLQGTVGDTAARMIGGATVGAVTAGVLGGDPLLGAAGSAVGALLPQLNASASANEDSALEFGPADVEIGAGDDPTAELLRTSDPDMTYMDGDSRAPRRYSLEGGSIGPIPDSPVLVPDSNLSISKRIDAETSLWIGDRRLEEALASVRIPRAAAATNQEDIALVKELWALAGQKASASELSYAAALRHATDALAAASTALERQQAGAALQSAQTGIARVRNLLIEVDRPHFTGI